MADVQKWYPHNNQGLKITDEYSAKIDLRFDENTVLQLRRNSVAYKDFTVSESGVTGTEVQRGTATTSIGIVNFYPSKSFQVSLPNTYSPNASYGVDNGIKVAMYVSNNAAANGYAEPVFIFYNESNDSFMSFYNNVSNISIQGIQLDTDRKMESVNLANGNSNLQNMTTYSLSGAGASMRGNGYWPSGNYFYYNEFSTNIPIFDTENHAKAYLRNSEDIEGLLNGGGDVDPEELYVLDQKYYYLHNIFTHNYHGTKSTAWYNYRWKPGYNSKIRLYRVKPSDSRYYTLVLTVPGGLTRLKGPKGEYSDEDAFEVDEGNLQTHFQEYSYTISRVAPRDEVTVTDFDTNIPIWGSAEDATKYANDELSIEDALNYSDILAYEQQLPEPAFGDADIETETGVNGQTYAAGSSVYVLSRSEMIQFFTEIFKIQDPTFINAFKDGNVLFGDNQANAIIGCMYFPFDASMVCSLESSSGSIWVGGWESQNATGKKVNYNDKVINVGEFFLPDMFQDFRDYEPYTNLYVQLPYCGTYQLSIQKYINKTVKITYAVDIFTGTCTALIYADNILLDSMDGQIGSQRPVTGRTAANILGAITKGSASVVAGTAAGVKGSMALAGAGEAVANGGAGIAALGIGAGTQTAFAANALAVGAGAVGVAGAGVAAVAGVDMMYKAKNAYADPPMSTRGQYSGNLGMFGNQKVHFIVAIRHNYRPENELDLIGFPSGRGGPIGSFSGFLKSTCVYLADGFIGSVQERNEILEMIAKGIYI